MVWMVGGGKQYCGSIGGSAEGMEDKRGLWRASGASSICERMGGGSIPRTDRGQVGSSGGSGASGIHGGMKLQTKSVEGMEG